MNLKRGTPINPHIRAQIRDALKKAPPEDWTNTEGLAILGALHHIIRRRRGIKFVFRQGRGARSWAARAVAFNPDIG